MYHWTLALETLAFGPIAGGCGIRYLHQADDQRDGVPKHFAINLFPVGWALYEEKCMDHRELFANFYLCTEEQEGIQAEAAQPGT